MIGIVMPVWLQEQPLLDLTLQAARHLRSSEECKLFVVTTRLHLCTPEELCVRLQNCTDMMVEVLHEPGVSISVAGAWNRGAAKAMYEGAEFLMVCANDAFVESETIDRLIEHGRRSNDDLWSAIDTRDKQTIDESLVTDGPDFSCFMYRPSVFEKYGYFDERYKPGYFEDNDYYVRIVLGGGSAVNVHAAKFYHHGSMTTKLDGEAAHHVRHWFGINRKRFADKWGTPNPPPNAELVRQHCYAHPWNDPSLHLSFCNR